VPFNRRHRYPRVEALLQRVLLSVSVVKETLTIEGTAGKDEISVSVHPNVINLMSVKVNGEEKVFLLGSFKVININALGGNDTVRIRDLYDGHPAYLNVDLGPGNDRAYGSPYDDKIMAGTGNDRISAGAGDDYVNAGGGDDVIVGDAGNDTLIGLAGDDTIYGGAGKDEIFAGDGADSLDGGDAADVVDGGWGNDRIVETDLHSPAGDEYYARNANLINGGAGDDYIEISHLGSMSAVLGGDGDDYLYATSDGPYVDGLQMKGEGGDDKIISPVANGGAGNDTIVTFEFFGQTAVNGGDGDDRITVVGGSNGSVNGGYGNDVIDSERGYNTVINGESGDDRLTSRSGTATLTGGAGNDLIATNGRAEGGAGDDLLRPASGYLKGDVTPAAVDFSGGDGNDLLIGSSYSDTLRGNDGNDSLFAGGMDDRDRDDDGKDFAYGEKGEDFFDKKSKWSATDKSNSDAGSFKTGSSGNLVSGGTLVIDSNGTVSFDDLLTLAQNYGSSGFIKSGGSMTTGVSFNDLLHLAQNYGSGTINNPSTPTPTAPTADDAIAIYKNAAIFSGMFASSTSSTETQLPELLTSERKSIRGQIVHLPSDWTLTRVGKMSGLVWYKVQLPDASRAKVYGSLLGKPVAGYYTNERSRPTVGTQNLFVNVMGVHPATVIMHDATAGSTDYSTWTSPASFASSKSLVTKAGTGGMLAELGETFSINKPLMNVLEGVLLVANQRYIYTAQGLRTIDANGIGAIVS
jgi:Ca2+-binding RTX toxin-like protein